MYLQSHNLKDKYVYVAVVMVDILGFLSGSSITWTSPILPKLNSETRLDENPIGRVITDDENSWIGSLAAIGGIVGPALFVFIFEHLGRKIGIILVNVPYLLAFMSAAFGKTVWIFYLSRIFAGIGISASFVAMPMYVGEVSEKHNRGLLASTTSIFIVSGLLFPYCVGPFTSILVFNIILCIFPIISVVGTILLLPESPHFLLHKKKYDEALACLRTLRGSSGSTVDKEFEEMKIDVAKVHEGGVMDLFKTKASTKAFLLSTILVNLQQFSGISVLLAYTEDIFSSVGTDLDPALSSIITGLAQFVTCFITPIFVESKGRKTLLLFSLTGIILSLTTFGTFFYLKNHEYNVDGISWLPIASFIVFVLFYNSGFGGLPWTVMAELYPLNIKSVGSSLATSIYWITGFLLTYYFNSLSNAIGTEGSFWFFAGMCCISVGFIHFFLIETKGKSLQEIQDILAA